MAAVFGSGRQQVACDEKFSAEPDWGGQGGAWQWEAGYKGEKGGVERKVGGEPRGVRGWEWRRGRRTKGDEQTGDVNNEEEDGSQSFRPTDRQTGGRARDSSPERRRGARHRIRAVYPLCLGLLHGDNTQYESFMRGAFINNTLTHTLWPASFIHFALFYLLPRDYSRV